MTNFVQTSDTTGANVGLIESHGPPVRVARKAKQIAIAERPYGWRATEAVHVERAYELGLDTWRWHVAYERNPEEK